MGTQGALVKPILCQDSARENSSVCVFLLLFLFWRKAWQRHGPMRGFEDVFLLNVHRLGRRDVVSAEVPPLAPWQSGSSSLPRGGHLSITCSCLGQLLLQHRLVWCSCCSASHHLSQSGGKKVSINNSRLFKLQLLICASHKWLARCQGFLFGLFLPYFYYFCINLGKKNCIMNLNV